MQPKLLKRVPFLAALSGEDLRWLAKRVQRRKYSRGDIIFVNLQQYMSVRKTSGIRAETSVHLWFDQDITAFRFILRVAGEPWWNSVITRLNGTNTLSAYVTLAARA